jgi:hypothetical protein
LADTTISHGFEEMELNCWVNPDDKCYLKGTTKVEYAGKVKEALKEKFPNHPCWWGHIGDEYSWWTLMQKGLQKAANCTQNNIEDVSKTIHPLYLENKPVYQPEELPTDYQRIRQSILMWTRLISLQLSRT